MSGTIDWNALPDVIELLGVRDVEALIMQLMTIKMWTDKKHG